MSAADAGLDDAPRRPTDSCGSCGAPRSDERHQPRRLAAVEWPEGCHPFVERTGESPSFPQPDARPAPDAAHSSSYAGEIEQETALRQDESDDEQAAVDSYSWAAGEVYVAPLDSDPSDRSAWQRLGDLSPTPLAPFIEQAKEDVSQLAATTATPRLMIERPADVDEATWLAANPALDSTAKLSIPRHWSFKDKGVAAGFDDHVREQLPWYDLVTGAVTQVVRHYLPTNGHVIDLGCSTGNVGRALADDLEVRNAALTAVDEAAEMAELYDAPGQLVVDTIEHFIRQSVTTGLQADVVVAFLSLMFIPAADLAEIVDRIEHQVLRPGGALIVVDRLQPDDGYAGLVKTRLTLAGKLRAGATPDEIISKELSLAGVQRPLPKDLFPQAIEFFRFADFTALLIERPI